jgi:hypothetical protein
LFDRLGRQGTLKIDNKDETVVEGTSQGILQMLNAGSNLYIGKYIVNTNKKLKCNIFIELPIFIYFKKWVFYYNIFFVYLICLLFLRMWFLNHQFCITERKNKILIRANKTPKNWTDKSTAVKYKLRNKEHKIRQENG